MRIDVKSMILVFLMLVLSLSVATNSLNGEVETPTFEEIVEPLNVILPIADQSTLMPIMASGSVACLKRSLSSSSVESEYNP